MENIINDVDKMSVRGIKKQYLGCLSYLDLELCQLAHGLSNAH